MVRVEIESIRVTGFGVKGNTYRVYELQGLKVRG